MQKTNFRKIKNLSVSVVLYKTEEKEVQHVIDQLALSKLTLKLYLIDNSPTDAIKAKISLNDTIVYIHTGKNLGFGAGHNIAIHLAKDISEFHLVLNADVIFKSIILKNIYVYMKLHADIGLLSPKIYNLDGSLQYSVKLLPTPVNLIVRRFIPIKTLKERLNYKYELKFFNFDDIIEPPYVSGCFMFINTNVFEEISGFDERFFMYPEDIDLTRRIFKKYRVIFYPFEAIYHAHGKGSYKSKKLLYYHVTSMIKYFNKWGWFIDNDRKKINNNLISQIYKNQKK
jgi:hypothetical protein